MRNALYVAGFFSFVFSIFVIFQFKKGLMAKRVQLSSRILQASITSQYLALKQQILQLADIQSSLNKGEGDLQSATLSESSVELLALLELKNKGRFSWVTASSAKFQTKQVVKNVLQKTEMYLSTYLGASRFKEPTVFALTVLDKPYLALALPYKGVGVSSWVLAILPKLSFISWLPFQEGGGPFSLLNSSSDIISHAKYSYISKKTIEPWAMEQNQLGLLENYRFVYKNSDFVFQIFSKIEGSSLLLSSSWSMRFWPLFFQLLIVFCFSFFFLPFLFYRYFSIKEKLEVPQLGKNFSKKSAPAITSHASEPELESVEVGLPLQDTQNDLVSLQELPAHSSIIKDLKSLIDDLDSKPLSKVDEDFPVSLPEKESGL